MIGEKLPRWESELWSYISCGSGMECPLFIHCRVRQSGRWCPGKVRESITRLLDDEQFDIGKYNGFPKMGVGGPCKIFQLVATLAARLINKGEISCPPVPARIVSLADEQHGVKVHLLPLKVYHGAVWYTKHGWLIQLKDNDSSALKRFTMFHETFHILAHCKTMPVFRKRGCIQGSFNELLADYFAACVLMPKKWIQEKWAEFEDLDKMVEIFDVPKPVMWLRLRRLGLM